MLNGARLSNFETGRFVFLFHIFLIPIYVQLKLFCMLFHLLDLVLIVLRPLPFWMLLQGVSVPLPIPHFYLICALASGTLALIPSFMQATLFVVVELALHMKQDHLLT